MYKVKQRDLIGEVKDFPIEVVQKMLERQVEQGNKEDVQVFQRCVIEDYPEGGFAWNETKEGQSFWSEITVEDNFDLFLKRYPGRNGYYRGVEGRGNEIIKALEEIGARNARDFEGDNVKCLYFIKENGYIGACADHSLLADILQRGFTELFLPEIETLEICGKKFRKDEVIERIKDLKEEK